jgi:hypothetical protein
MPGSLSKISAERDVYAQAWLLGVGVGVLVLVYASYSIHCIWACFYTVSNSYEGASRKNCSSLATTVPSVCDIAWTHMQKSLRV